MPLCSQDAFVVRKAKGQRSCHLSTPFLAKPLQHSRTIQSNRTVNPDQVSYPSGTTLPDQIHQNLAAALLSHRVYRLSSLPQFASRAR
uniref:Uncharacterized protein n=1 Tax=Arundo donax TaxID=35708 RepID=A0A0A9EMU0_ARUDO